MIDSNLANLDILTLKQASDLFGVTRQALWAAIKKGILKATLHKGGWIINKGDLLEYEKLKYSRARSLFNGQPLYDAVKGEISVNEAALLIQETPQHIYYLLRTGKLPGIHKGGVWVLNYAQLESVYRLREKKEDETQMRFA